jgi:hypothetical protein
MSKRHSDRVKVIVSWVEPSDNPLGSTATSYINKCLRDHIPKSSDWKCGYIREHATRRKDDDRIRHSVEYKFHFKRGYWTTNQPAWHTVLAFIVTLRAMADKAPGILDFKVDFDMNADRMPWVFRDGSMGDSVSQIAVRPGAATYNLILPEPRKLPSHPLKELHFMEDASYVTMSIPEFDQLMIIGEPRAAYKERRYYRIWEEGGSLSKIRNLGEKATSHPDNVIVLARNTKTDGKWRAITDDNHVAKGHYLHHVLTGETEPVDGSHSDLGLRYNLVRLKD